MGVAGNEWVRGFGLGFTNPGGTRGKWDMCLCFGCGSVGGAVEVERAVGPGQDPEGWGGVKSVFVVNLDYLC